MLEPQPVVSWEMFERLALSSGVTQQVLPKAAKYLHQLGSLVHFNERESGLDDLVILDRYPLPPFLFFVASTESHLLFSSLWPAIDTCSVNG